MEQRGDGYRAPDLFLLDNTESFVLYRAVTALKQARAGAPLLRVGLGAIGLCIIGYIVGPPLYWHLMEGVAVFRHSSSPTCPHCDCDCSSQPLLSIPGERDLNSEEMFLWVGDRYVRSLFQAAKKKARCITFIGEIDAVGSTSKQWGRSYEEKYCINYLLK